MVDDEYYPLSRPEFSSSVEAMLTVLNQSTFASEGVLIGGDFHHFSSSTIQGTKLLSVVSSGMTAKSLTSSSFHGSLLFWATSLFPASVGPFKSSAPNDIFLGKNFVVVERQSDGKLKVVPVIDENSVVGRGASVNWLVRNVRLEHYLGGIAVLFVLAIRRFLK